MPWLGHLENIGLVSYGDLPKRWHFIIQYKKIVLFDIITSLIHGVDVGEAVKLTAAKSDFLKF